MAQARSNDERERETTAEYIKFEVSCWDFDIADDEKWRQANFLNDVRHHDYIGIRWRD